MSKKIISFFFFTALLLFSGNLFSQCNAHKLSKDLKPNLGDYKYDSYAYNQVTFTDKPQTIEVLFTAFAGEKYKLVLATSLFDENVQVNIYDKSMRSKKRNKLYDNAKGLDNLFWSLEISDPGIYYIDYEIPPKGDFKSTDGCIVMLIGYMDK
jgi:hypothetical protein